MRSPVRFWRELSSSQRRFEPLSSGSPGQGKAELALNMRAVATRQPPNLALRKVKMSWQFTVGVMANGKGERIVVGAEDALIAALRVKAERPEAAIMYVRRLNRRGDARHPPHSLTGLIDSGCT